jgi:hypothetical protein
MARAMAPTATGTGNVVFEVERLEQSDGGLLELSGRWFGVRGRRFVRPTLTMATGGRSHRLLADLAHKPWPAEDGAEWIAAFHWDGDPAELGEIELSVAPDISIRLVSGAAPEQAANAPGDAAVRLELQRSWADLTDERRASERLRRELASAHDSLDEAREQLEQLRAATIEADAAIARRDAALAKLDTLEGEHAETARALERALYDRDQAAKARDQATKARDQAAKARDHALTERDEATAARDRSALREQTEREARRPVPAAPDGPPPRTGPSPSLPPIIQPLSRRHHLTPDIDWGPRGIAIVVLLAAIVAFLVVARIL